MGTLKEQWLILISTPVYIIIIGLELLLSHLQHRKTYTLKDSMANLYLMLLNMGIDLAFRIVYLVILNYFYLHAWISINEGILYWFMLLILEDFVYYWLHRFDHEVRLFWAVHVTHHSSQQLNFTVGFRSSVFQPLYRFIYFIPLAFISATSILPASSHFTTTTLKPAITALAGLVPCALIGINTTFLCDSFLWAW